VNYNPTTKDNFKDATLPDFFAETGNKPCRSDATKLSFVFFYVLEVTATSTLDTA